MSGTLIDNPSFTQNEIYKIDTNELVEGAGVGSSFSGIGVDNEPHQQLANRTFYLKQRVDTNSGNITIMQGFAAAFTGSRGPVGNIRIPYIDVNFGAQFMIFQWGFMSFIGQTSAAFTNATPVQNFTVPFPNQCSTLIGALQTNFGNNSHGALQSAALSVESMLPYSKTQAVFYIDWNGLGTVYVAGGSDGFGPSRLGLTGVSWWALGY